MRKGTDSLESELIKPPSRDVKSLFYKEKMSDKININTDT